MYPSFGNDIFHNATVHACICIHGHIGQDEKLLCTLSAHVVLTLSSSCLVHLCKTKDVQVVHKLINVPFLKIDHSVYTTKWASMRHPRYTSMFLAVQVEL